MNDEDEDAVEAELSALIDQETVHEKLPEVPSEEPMDGRLASIIFIKF